MSGQPIKSELERKIDVKCGCIGIATGFALAALGTYCCYQNGLNHPEIIKNPVAEAIAGGLSGFVMGTFGAYMLSKVHYHGIESQG